MGSCDSGSLNIILIDRDMLWFTFGAMDGVAMFGACAGSTGMVLQRLRIIPAYVYGGSVRCAEYKVC